MKKIKHKDAIFVMKINSQKKQQIQSYCKRNGLSLAKLIDVFITDVLLTEKEFEK